MAVLDDVLRVADLLQEDVDQEGVPDLLQEAFRSRPAQDRKALRGRLTASTSFGCGSSRNSP